MTSGQSKSATLLSVSVSPTAKSAVIVQISPITTGQVAVIVLNWNGRDDTLACIESLEKQTYGPTKIIVVDNGSEDDSVCAIKARFPGITTLCTGENLGYAGGNNVGLRHVINSGDCEFVLVLNNDTLAPPDFVESLVHSSIEVGSRAVLSPLIVDNRQPPRIWYNGARWDRSKLMFVLDKLPRPMDMPLVEETQIAIGCALFARVSVFVEIGVFDERLFLMHEESDWCFRAAKRGYKCYVTRRTKLTHRVSVSFGRSDSLLMRYFEVRNRLYFAERHLSWSQWASTFGSCVSNLVSIPMDAFPWTPPRGLRTSPKRWYWAVRRHWQDSTNSGLPTDYSLLSQMFVQLFAIFDYLRRRTGDCPNWLRKLNQAT